MRAVGTPAALASLLGATDVPNPAPPAAGAAGGRAGAAPAAGAQAPFAAMLATRLVSFKPGDAARAAEDDASASDDGAAGPNPDGNTAPAAPALLAALAAAGAPVPATAATTGPATDPVTPATTGAAKAAGVKRASRDPNALAPALQERLGRVVARMKRDYGHDVQIAETGRTQARQDYLYAQGRTRSGPVVTWTRDSAHTRGRAVDVTVDGGYTDPTAFARLQQVARVEGLRTLGPRDPGHLELPRDVPGEVAALGDAAGARVTVESFGVTTEPAGAGAGAPAQPSSVASAIAAMNAAIDSAAVAPTAHVARVAAVAGVAPVATVASVAAPAALSASMTSTTAVAPKPTRAPREADRQVDRGADHGSTRDVAPARRSHARDPKVADPGRTPVAVTAGASSHATNDAPDGEGAASGGHTPDRRADARDTRTGLDTTGPGPRFVAPLLTVADSGPAATAATPAPAASESTAAPALGAVAAERIARVLDAQQAAAPRTVSHLTLRVERAEGGEDRIRLDVRGRAVDARIDVADLDAADHLATRTPELRAALAQHGLTTDDVRVRTTAALAIDATVLSASVGGATRAGFDTSSQHPGGGGASGQTPRDADARPDARGDDRPRGDGGAADARAGDRRQNRRPAPDAYLDAPTPRAGRPTR
ncbi:hypothetical protein tb265_17850 [Gemmatimonadetes bacterium T265]|nr:hypothetical protein tb265_17850 [Gemmatimonadetes bacterium T265]